MLCANNTTILILRKQAAWFQTRDNVPIFFSKFSHCSAKVSIQFGPNTSPFTEQIIQKKKDLEEERVARAKLEERVAQLESEHVTKENKNEVTEEVDKSIAAIGGFGKRTIEKAKKPAHELLEHVHGFHEVPMVDGNSVVGIAQFDTLGNAMKFIGSQKKHPQIQTNNLWVAENRSRMERNQATGCQQTGKKFD